jgi:hypothetical protein
MPLQMSHLLFRVEQGDVALQRLPFLLVSKVRL